MQVPGTDQTHYGTRLQVGAPFVTLFKLPLQRNEPDTYAVGVLSVTAPPSTDTRVESVGGKVVKGRLWSCWWGGDGSLSSERRKSCAQRPPPYLSSKLGDRTRSGHERRWDDVRVQNRRVVITQEVLVEPVGVVGAVKENLLLCERFPTPSPLFL